MRGRLVCSRSQMKRLAPACTRGVFHYTHPPGSSAHSTTALVEEHTHTHSHIVPFVSGNEKQEEKTITRMIMRMTMMMMMMAIRKKSVMLTLRMTATSFSLLPGMCPSLNPIKKAFILVYFITGIKAASHPREKRGLETLTHLNAPTESSFGKEGTHLKSPYWISRTNSPKMDGD